MQRIPYTELRAAEALAARTFSQNTKVKAILLTGGRVAVEVWHAKSAITWTPDPHDVAAEIRGEQPHVPEPAHALIRGGR